MQTMQKKDQKLAEIDVVLKQDIQPAVEKVRCTTRLPSTLLLSAPARH